MTDVPPTVHVRVALDAVASTACAVDVGGLAALVRLAAAPRAVVWTDVAAAGDEVAKGFWVETR